MITAATYQAVSQSLRVISFYPAGHRGLGFADAHEKTGMSSGPCGSRLRRMPRALLCTCPSMERTRKLRLPCGTRRLPSFCKLRSSPRSPNLIYPHFQNHPFPLHGQVKEVLVPRSKYEYLLAALVLLEKSNDGFSASASLHHHSFFSSNCQRTRPLPMRDGLHRSNRPNGNLEYRPASPLVA